MTAEHQISIALPRGKAVADDFATETTDGLPYELMSIAAHVSLRPRRLLFSRRGQ